LKSELSILQEIVNHVFLDSATIEPRKPGDERLEAIGQRLLELISMPAIGVQAIRFDRSSLIDVDRRHV